MSADPQTCHVCGAPRPLYKLGLRGYCGKHRPGMREEVAIIARFIGRFGDQIKLEPVVREADELSKDEAARDHQPVGPEVRPEVRELR